MNNNLPVCDGKENKKRLSNNSICNKIQAVTVHYDSLR